MAEKDPAEEVVAEHPLSGHEARRLILRYPELYGNVVDADKVDDIKDGQVTMTQTADGNRHLKSGTASKAKAKAAESGEQPELRDTPVSTDKATGGTAVTS
jgi:hypothetical protein